MDTTTTKFVHQKLQIKDIIDHKPYCSDAEFTMPSNFSFKEKIETIKLHFHDYIAFGRNHDNQFLVEFLDYNTLTWKKQLKISIDIIAERFVSFMDNLNIVYFVILDPSTLILKFDEKEWSFQTYNAFDDPSQGSFINDQNIYFIRNGSIFCLSLLYVFEDGHSSAPIFELSSSFSKNENNSEIDAAQNISQIKKYSLATDYFDQKDIFATQQFSHYNLIYRNDDDLPLLIFDTTTNSFCFENELQTINLYFRRKQSSISPLNDAKFMVFPGKNNCLLLFHNFESSQNTLIPILQPIMIQECQNENGEPLIIIAISVKRISPIISMFSLPGEGFNFISVTSNNYYQYYKSCGLLSSINHSKSIINLKHKICGKQGTNDQNQKIFTEETLKQQYNIVNYINKEEEKLKSSINTSEDLESKNKLIFMNEFKKKLSQLHKEKDKTPINCNYQVNNEITSTNNLDETSLIPHPKNDNQHNKTQSENKTKIQMIMHFLSLGPSPKLDIPQIEIDIEPEYHMIITTPIIPHCLFIKSVEIIVTCTEKNGILSFFLKPHTCINPQKIEVKCSPNSDYKVKIKVFNGYQPTCSDTIEFTTPNAGIPPKVEDFFGSYASNDTYIFKWTNVSDSYDVKYYILEGSRETPIIQKPIDFNPSSDSNEHEELTQHNQPPINNFIFDQNSNQEADNFLDDNFEQIIELSNDVESSNICGAKLKIISSYRQFRIRASNSVGIGEPSDPCAIIRKSELPQKKEHKASPRIGKDQVQYLSDFYETNPNPNFEERNKIANLLSLSYQTVSSWFARKRHADKVNSQKLP